MKTYKKDLKEIMVMLTDDERESIQDCAFTFYDLLDTFGCNIKSEMKFQPVEMEGYSQEARDFLKNAKTTYETLMAFKNILSITGYKDKNEDY